MSWLDNILNSLKPKPKFVSPAPSSQSNTPAPIPVPTPYQPPAYGGNPYLKPGTTGQVLSSQVQPVAGPTLNGNVMFSNGVTYPRQNVLSTPLSQNYSATTPSQISAQSQPGQTLGIQDSSNSQPSTNNGGGQTSSENTVEDPFNLGTYIPVPNGANSVNLRGTEWKLGDLQKQLDINKSAEAAKQSRLKAINDRIAMIKDVGNRNVSQAGDVRNEIVGNIGTTYDNLISRAGQAKESSLANLGQEDVNVQSQYGRAEGTARRAIESALTRNRMMARSLNRLGGSYYTDQQASTNETGARSISDIGSELAGKRSGIQTRTTDTKNYFEAQAQDLANEGGQLKSQADQEYQKQVNAANDMQRSYGIDSEEQAAQAEQEYQSRLDQINEYIQNKALTLAGIAGTAATREGAITGNNPVDSTLGNILNNTQALTNANQATSSLGSGFSTPTTTGTNNMLGFSGRPLTEYEKEQLRLGNLYGGGGAG